MWNLCFPQVIQVVDRLGTSECYVSPITLTRGVGHMHNLMNICEGTNLINNWVLTKSKYFTLYGYWDMFNTSSLRDDEI